MYTTYQEGAIVASSRTNMFINLLTYIVAETSNLYVDIIMNVSYRYVLVSFAILKLGKRATCIALDLCTIPFSVFYIVVGCLILGIPTNITFNAYNYAIPTTWITLVSPKRARSILTDLVAGYVVGI